MRILEAVERFYGLAETKLRESVYDPRVTAAIWDVLSTAVSFQNLAVDDLAFVYENTLVTKEARQHLEIHSTPPRLASYIVERLPFQALPSEKRTVLEPFCGHGVFLLTALRRLRDFLPRSCASEQRHEYFVGHLRGIELDPFAREVARLCLTLADYPNPDGWVIRDQNVFQFAALKQDLEWANIVLFNPPLNDFTAQERTRLDNVLTSIHKPAEILGRVLESPPALLGAVLPEIFLSGSGYRALRERLGKTYRQLEVAALPKGIFEHSDTASVLLIASEKQLSSHTTHVINTRVKRQDRKEFLTSGLHSSQHEFLIGPWDEVTLWKPELDDVWHSMSRYHKLGDIAELHRGIEWNVSVGEHESELFSRIPKAGFAAGIRRVKAHLEPFMTHGDIYLAVGKHLARTRAHQYAWNKPKVLVNAHPCSRGAWRLIAAPDYHGLIPYQTFISIWPHEEVSPTTLAAILNGPVANAFVATHETWHDNRIAGLKAIPIPDIGGSNMGQLEELVSYYIKSVQSGTHTSARSYLLQIDALILQAYDLPPKMEKELLDYFQGEPRPVPFSFTGYFPTGFRPAIPLHQYISREYEQASAGRVLDSIEPINDAELHEVVKHLWEQDNG